LGEIERLAIARWIKKKEAEEVSAGN